VRVIAEFGTDDLARVYVARADENDHRSGESAARLGEATSCLVEFVESVQPPIPRDEKWVLIVSTLYGCPVGCAICDAGGWYDGPISAEGILDQILFMVDRRFENREVPVPKFKIQFARMGEPAFNDAVIELLRRLPRELHAPGLVPSVSTVAPAGREAFFEDLLRVKNELYSGGRFQFQFSIHSTDPAVRKRLVPVRSMPFDWMAGFGSRFHQEGDQKVTLNFAAAAGVPVVPASAAKAFSPEHFLVKLTPVNPTVRAGEADLESRIDPERPETGHALKAAFEREGFDVILSVGEAEENRIGSNCGMFVSELRRDAVRVRDGYAAQSYACEGAREK